MASLVPESVASASGNNATATCPYPTGIVAGNLLLLTMIANDRFDHTFATPSGFTAVQAGGVSTTAPYMATFMRIATGSESGSISSAQNAGTNWHSRMVRWSGNNSVGVAVSSQSLDDTSNTTATSATLTPSGGSTIIMIVGAAGSVTVSGYTFTTSPPTFTEYSDDVAQTLAIAIAYGERPESTATGTGSATLSGAARSVVHLLSCDPYVPPIEAVPLTATSTLVVPVFTAAVTVTSVPLAVTGTLTEPVLTTEALSDWSNEDKSTTPTWANQSKS
jgi:hypothetical protein